jgi:hypothetical protein
MTSGMTTAADAAIADYLDDLRDATADLPRERRRELVRDIEAHIATARAELDDPWSEAEVRTLLDRLGSVEEIAAAEGAEPEAPPAESPDRTWREPAAIVLLLFGGFIAGFGWVAGVFLLWWSPKWSTFDKLLGTLVLPGGLVTSFLATSLFVGQSAISTSDDATCEGFATVGPTTTHVFRQLSDCGSGPSTAVIVLLVLGALTPLMTAAYLAVAARRA